MVSVNMYGCRPVNPYPIRIAGIYLQDTVGALRTSGATVLSELARLSGQIRLRFQSTWMFLFCWPPNWEGTGARRPQHAPRTGEVDDVIVELAHDSVLEIPAGCQPMTDLSHVDLESGQ
jgi:hypothetical protein